jgi:hypothetical protein
LVGLVGVEVIVLAPVQTLEENYLLHLFMMAVMDILRSMEEERAA